MHSSRMCTSRSLTVCWGGLPARGASLPGGVSLPGGSPCPGVSLPGGLPGGVSLLGGLPAGGSPCPGGLPAREGVSLPMGSPYQGEGLPARGVSLPGGFSLPGGSPYPEGVSPCQGGLPAEGSPCRRPPMDRITDTCKNITLATTSLRPVKKMAAKDGHIDFMFLAPLPGRWIRCWDTVNKRAVRILLECILVYEYF